MSSRSAVPFLRWLPVLVPPLIIWWWMRDYLVNVPFMDDYVWLPFYEKFKSGNYSPGDLMYVQMEHRLTVPAVLAWIFYHLKPGNLLLLNWTSFTLLCLTGWNIIFLLRRTLPELKAQWLVATVAMLALFSPVQVSTLLWADCFSSYMAPFFITGAIAVLHTHWNTWLRLGLSLTAAVLGTISFGSGMLAWPLMVPLILWSATFADRRERMIFLSVWLAAAAITMRLYFVNLVNQGEPEFSYGQDKIQTFGGHIQAFVENPLQSLRFILLFGGSGLGRGTFASMQDMTLKAGALLALALGAACVPLFFSRDKKLLRVKTLPWIIIGLYTFAMGGMVAMSRMHDSKDVGALWNRYTIHSLPAVVAVIVLAFAWVAQMAAGEGKWRKFCVSVAPVALGLFVMHLIAGWIYGAQMMESWWSSRLRDATCQLFGKAVPQGAIQGPWTKGKNTGFNWKFPVRMDNIGLLQPPMPQTNLLSNFKVNKNRTAGYSARMDGIAAVSPGRFRASGVAFVRGESRPADGVLLCYKDISSGEWRIFAVAQVRQPPVFLRQALDADMQYLHAPRTGRKQMFYGEWEMDFAPRKEGGTAAHDGELPDGVHEIAAWTFDFPDQTASRMSGLYRLDSVNGTVAEMDDPDALARKK